MKLPSLWFTLGISVFANTLSAQEPPVPKSEAQQLRGEIQGTESELQEITARLKQLKERLAKAESATSPLQLISPGPSFSNCNRASDDGRSHPWCAAARKRIVSSREMATGPIYAHTNTPQVA